VSIALLAVVRPIATRHLAEGPAHPQLDGVRSVVGRTARVTQAVDRHSGRIRLGADEWSARTQHSGETFAIGDTVRILEVEGATAVVGDAFE
jgi:membrane protein implicated in regulation of membrane protease activity